MNYFTFIFSLYFLVLSIVPCTDIHATDIPATQALKVVLSDHHTDCPHEKEQDFCPPFCICNCCGQIFVTARNYKLHLPSLNKYHLQEKSHFYYTENRQSDYLSSIFRPPQV